MKIQFILFTSFFLAILTTSSSWATEVNQTLLKAIHYSQTNQVASTLADDGSTTFPHAKSCSCNLTDSCSVSCGEYETADCRPYQGDFNGWYCSCQCVESEFP